MSRLLRFIVLVGLLLGIGVTLLSAQEDPEPPQDSASAYEEALSKNVWVTTQDRSSLRSGPSKYFERLEVIPPATTMRAIGRTTDTRWVQVEYNGQRGWVAAWLLVWTGDMVGLNIDGIDPEPYARKIGILARTTRNAPIYNRWIDAKDRAGTIPAGTEVELTGRYKNLNYQIRYEGELYWIGWWDVSITYGQASRLLDTSYLYAFGRLIGTTTNAIGRGVESLRSIEGIWLALDSGQAVSCNLIPPVVDRRYVTDADIEREPIFSPAVEAFDEGIVNTNSAILAFEDACGRDPSEFYITESEVREALEDLDAARRSFNLSRSLLASLSTRDPVERPNIIIEQPQETP